MNPQSKYGWPQMCLLAAAGLILYFVLIPFIVHGELIEWDMPGHLENARFVKEHLLPWWFGWNPAFFAGFPQGTLYPPLFHYVTALVGLVMPIEWAFKIIVAVSVAASIYFAYLLARSRGLSSERASLAALGFVTLIAGPVNFSSNNNAIGGTLFSTFNVGLVVNAAALPIFLAYAASVWALAERRRGVVLPSVLLATLLCLHTITFLAAALFAVTVLLSDGRSKKTLRDLSGHGLLSAVLSAFWLLPFLFLVSYSQTEKIELTLGSGSFVLLTGGVVLCVWLLFENLKGELRSAVIYFLFLAIIILGVNLLQLPLHVYRLVLFPVCILPMLAASVMPRRLIPLCSVVLVMLVGYGIRFGFYALNLEERAQRAIAPAMELPATIERILVLVSTAEQPATHFSQLLLPRLMHVDSAKGLFVESSLNAAPLLMLERLYDPQAMIWGVPVPETGMLAKSEKRMLAAKLSNIFAINSLVSYRIPDGFDLEQARDFASYNHERKYLKSSDGTTTVRIFDESRYFYLTQSNLIYLDRRFLAPHAEVFGRPSELTQRMVLSDGRHDFFVERVDPDIWKVDFAIAQGELTDGSPAAISFRKLEAVASGLTLTPDQKNPLSHALAALEDSLVESEKSVAISRYHDAPKIILSKLPAPSFALEEALPKLQNDKIVLRQYNLVKRELVEPLREKPVAVGRLAWKETLWQWLRDPYVTQILVRDSSAQFEPVEGALVSKAVWSKDRQELKFRIDSPDPSPVLAKISYFPRWRAYQDGTEIEVHEASPSLMLLKGKGEITLRYEALWFDYAGAFLTLGGLAAVFFMIRRRNTEKA